jgi:hypothetical protein
MIITQIKVDKRESLFLSFLIKSDSWNLKEFFFPSFFFVLVKLIDVFYCLFLLISCLETKKKLFLKRYRNKAIQALQATLHRYDEEVGNDRTRELQDLQKAFEMQKTEFSQWKETINEPQIKL